MDIGQTENRLMLIKQGRVWAKTVEQALEIIYSKYGHGTVCIYEMQRRGELIWFEYNIDLREVEG